MVDNGHGRTVRLYKRTSLLSAYYVATLGYKRMRVTTRVYGTNLALFFTACMHMDTRAVVDQCVH